MTNVRQCASQIDKTGSGYEEGDGLTVVTVMVVTGSTWVTGVTWVMGVTGVTGGITGEGEKMSP